MSRELMNLIVFCHCVCVASVLQFDEWINKSLFQYWLNIYIKSVSNGYTYLASADHSKVVRSSLLLKDAVNNVMKGCESLLQYSHTLTQRTKGVITGVHMILTLQRGPK